MARPEALAVPVFLAVPVALEGPADHRALAPVVREVLVAQEGLGAPVALVVREAPVGQAALAVPRPVTPARSLVRPPLQRHGSPRRRDDGPAGSISVRFPWRIWSCSNSGSRSAWSCSRST